MLHVVKRILIVGSLSCLVLGLASCGGSKSPNAAGPASEKGEINTLTAIKIDDGSDNTVIQISGQKPLSPNVFKLTDPLRVIIDFTDTQLGEVNSPIGVNNGVINEITASQFDDVSSSLSRVVIGFDALVDYQVNPQDNMITVTIPKQGAVAAKPEQTTPTQDSAPMDTSALDAGVTADSMVGTNPNAENVGDVLAEIPTEELGDPGQLANTLEDISYSVNGDQTTVELIGNGSINDYQDFVLENPKRLVVDLKGLKSAVKGKKSLKLSEGMVSSIRTGAHSDKIRIVVDFSPNSAPNYQLNKTNTGLNILVASSAFGDTSSSNIAEPVPAPAPVETAAAAPQDELLDISNLPLEAIPVEGADAAAAVAETTPATEAQFSGGGASTAPYKVLSLDFVQITGNSRLIIKTSAPATYSTSQEGADTIIINLDKASLSKQAGRFLNTTAFNSPVATIVPKQVGNNARIVASLKEGVPFKVTQEGDLLYVDFERNKDYVATENVATAPSEIPAEAPAVDAAGAPAAPAVPDVGEESSAFAATGEAKAETAALAPPAVPSDANAELASEEEAFFNNKNLPAKEEKNKYEYVKEGLLSDSMKQAGNAPSQFGDGMIFEGGGSSKVYQGRKINLDFKEADIRSLFRLFADISKLNIIVGEDVNGKVTIRLRDVPWDQAFAILLQTQALGAIKYGNIIRIAPAEKIQKERELHSQAQKAAIAAAPIDTLFKAVSYASASEVSGHVKSVLSDRGTVNVDTRTNTLIIRDVREKLMEVKTLIDKLDAQTPQVTIEARIVEASDTFVRNWGVQWGASANFSAATGNPTGLLFPNSIGASGSQSPTPPLGGNNPILLNYPPVGSNASVTLNLGSINNVLDLDLLLGYEESEGNAKLISSPKVTVLDNRPATILSGTKIPFITQTANAGNNVRFESAVISITVTPHITADGSVIMQVQATRNEPDFGQSVLGNPSIIQREANTEVLVKSGNTTVIGGIYRVNRTRNQSGFPLLRKVPVLGWFFSNDNRRLDRQELLIFITPRIVGDERTVVRQIQG